VQRHDARRLHYDFRLEWDGVLLSWAVPKGPSLDPAIKRLAVHVEDHPLEYAGFEGDIPKGNYGAGHVDIWDSGIWVPHGDPSRDLAKGHLRFELQGGQLAGGWLLVRTGREGDQWILRKLDDAFAVAGHDAEIPAAPVAPRRGSQRKATAPDAGLPLPDYIEPQLATLTDAPPPGDAWSYEIKYDGYRMVCRLDGKHAAFYSRSRIDWSERMKGLAQRVAALGLGRGWLDGEVVVFDDRGASDFQALQNALDGHGGRLVYVVFDIPFWEGVDLRQQPLSERQRFLHELLQDLPADAPVMFTQQLGIADRTGAAAAWTEACRLSLEGLICKQLDAPYSAGRSRSWLKLKCRPREEFVIGGYSSPSGSRAHFGALLLGTRTRGDSLRYAGRAGTGFDQATLASLTRRLEQLESSECPFAAPPTRGHRFGRSGDEKLYWVRPELVAEIAYAGWTSDNVLRQASFVGLREDKPAEDVYKEQTLPAAQAGKAAASRTSAAKKGKASAAATSPRGARQAGRQGTSAASPAVAISHPQRLIYHAPDITKLELARYYEAVAGHMLPHVTQRRLAVLRCPNGTSNTCFFQKHLSEATPEGIELDDGQIVITSALGILALVQRGVVEFHTWGSRVPRADHADRITIDLDPDPNVGWAAVVEAAQLARTLLDALGLRPYLKTTGGKGLHLVAPVKASLPWVEVKTFAHNIALHLARMIPERFTANISKARRTGRVFVDYLRNGSGATAVAAFSSRARQGAPVSLPITWEELNEAVDLRGEAFNVRNVPELVAQRPDPWANYERDRIAITRSMTDRLLAKMAK